MAIDAAHPVPPLLPRNAGTGQIPPHVPKELIRSVGLTTGPEFLANPHDFMAKMHQNYPPIFYDVNEHCNAWQFIKHEDALFALRHWEYFSNEGATPFPRDPNDYFYFIPIEIDPPQHRKYRNIVDPLFSPQGVLKLEGLIRQRARDLLDQFADKGECEFTTAFGRPLPVSVFLDIMGLPQDMRDTFVEWAVDLLHAHDRETMGRAMKNIVAYIKQAIAEKKAHPDEGVVSRIAHAAPDGQPLSDKEVFGFVIFLFIGGLDTVFATLNNIWLWLAQNPDRCREIIARPQRHRQYRRGTAAALVRDFLRPRGCAGHRNAGRQDEEGRPHHQRAACLQLRSRSLPKPSRGELRPSAQDDPGIHRRRPQLHGRTSRPAGSQDRTAGVAEAHPEFSVSPDEQIVYRPGGVVGPENVPLVWKENRPA